MARNRGITDEMIIEYYQSGMRYKEMLPIVGISERAILNVLYKHNIPVNQVGQPRKHKVNEDFFKTWGHDMAWVLGLFITDGHVSKDIHSINLAQKDEELLRKVAKLMGASNIIPPIGTRTVPMLVINSKKLKDDLAEMGIGPNKSLTVDFPEIPEEYMPDFIRGVIDGDGCVDRSGYTVNITTASVKFANGLGVTFNKWGLQSVTTTYLSNSNTNIYRVWVKGKFQLLKLAEIIYKNANEHFISYKRENMTFHANPNNVKKIPSFSTKQDRIYFRTNISSQLLTDLRATSKQRDIPVNYLLEMGMERVLTLGFIDRELLVIPRDRIKYKSTYKKDLLDNIRAFAKHHNLFINEVIEYSANFIDER